MAGKNLRYILEPARVRSEGSPAVRREDSREIFGSTPGQDQAAPEWLWRFDLIVEEIFEKYLAEHDDTQWYAIGVAGQLFYPTYEIDHFSLYTLCHLRTVDWPDRRAVLLFFVVQARLTQHYLPARIKARLLGSRE